MYALILMQELPKLAITIENDKYEAVIAAFYKHMRITNGAEGETASKVSQFQFVPTNGKCILPIPTQTIISC
jgi:hypothetical protein